MLSKSSKVFVQFRFILAVAGDCRFQVVWHDGGRSTSVEAQGVLAATDEVLFLLRYLNLRIGELGTRQDCHESLGNDQFSGLLVAKAAELVAGIVDEHLVTDLVIDMRYRIALDLVVTEQGHELTASKRILGDRDIFTVKAFLGPPTPLETL